MDSIEYSTPTETSRRRFLHATAAGSALVGFGGLSTGVMGQSRTQTIRLGGEISGWQGRAPDSIAGETNPTLSLEAGTNYRVVWRNLDGMGHNFVVLDSEGNALERTAINSEQGATTTLEFTAREEMAEYVCEPHITSMRGEVAIGGGSTTPTENGTDESTTSEPETPEPFIPTGATIRTETLVDGGLVAPLALEVAPDEPDRRYIVDRPGQVYVHDSQGLRSKPFIDVSSRMVELGGEMGLLGIAFHPDYPSNRTFYLRYSAPLTDEAPDSFSHTEVLAEFRASEDSSTGVLESERRILEIPSPQDTHNAGAVTFGPDGYLYVSMGDGGGAHDDNPGHVTDWYERNAGGNGQDITENLLGSILRIDVDNREDGKPYAIPEDNPLVGEEGLDEQYAWGFRNPWKMGFSDGKLFVADVGQNGFEEVDIVRRDKNYGWNVREGTHCFKPGPEGSRNPPAECPAKLPPDVRGGERLISPVIEYPHVYEGQGVGSAVIGGYIYENDAIPTLKNKYVFGDFRKTSETEVPTGSLFAATPTDEGQWDLEELRIQNTKTGHLNAIVLALGRGHDGELYVLTSDTGTVEGETGAVHRIVPPKRPARANGDNATPGNATAGNATAGNATATNATAATDGTNATTTATTRTANDGSAATTGTLTRTQTGVGTAEGTDALETVGTEREAGSNGSEGGVSAGTSDESGPGFGALAALSALSIGAARLLVGRDES